MITSDEIYSQVEKFYYAHQKGLDGTVFIVHETQREAFPKASEQWHKENVVTGAYLPASNKVVFVAENIRNIEELNKTLRHEIFGHLALNRLNEVDKYDLLDTINKAPSDSDLGKQRDHLLSDVYKDLKDNPFRLAEEVVAHAAERSFEPIGYFQSIPDPKEIHTDKDLLEFIGALKNGIHHNVLEQQIFPETNDAQFKKEDKEMQKSNNPVNKEHIMTDNPTKVHNYNEIKVGDKTVDKVYTIRQAKIVEIPKEQLKSHETSFESRKEAITYQIAQNNLQNFTQEDKDILSKNYIEIVSQTTKGYPEYVQKAIIDKDYSTLKEMGFHDKAKIIEISNDKSDNKEQARQKPKSRRLTQLEKQLQNQTTNELER